MVTEAQIEKLTLKIEEEKQIKYNLQKKIWNKEKDIKEKELKLALMKLKVKYPNNTFGKLYVYGNDYIAGFSTTEHGVDFEDFSNTDDFELKYDMYHIIFITIDNQEGMEIARENFIISKEDLMKLKVDTKIEYNKTFQKI